MMVSVFLSPSGILAACRSGRLAAKSEACFGAGQARPPFEKPTPQKPGGLNFGGPALCRLAGLGCLGTLDGIS